MIMISSDDIKNHMEHEKECKVCQANRLILDKMIEAEINKKHNKLP